MTEKTRNYTEIKQVAQALEPLVNKILPNLIKEQDQQQAERLLGIELRPVFKKLSDNLSYRQICSFAETLPYPAMKRLNKVLWRKICEAEGIPLSSSTPGLIPGEQKAVCTTMKQLSTSFTQCNLAKQIQEPPTQTKIFFPEIIALQRSLAEILQISNSKFLEISDKEVHLQQKFQKDDKKYIDQVKGLRQLQQNASAEVKPEYSNLIETLKIKRQDAGYLKSFQKEKEKLSTQKIKVESDVTSKVADLFKSLKKIEPQQSSRKVAFKENQSNTKLDLDSKEFKPSK